MNIIRSAYDVFLDALFPLSETEEGLASLTPEFAYSTLPPAPSSPIKGAKGIFAYKDERVAKLVWNVKYKKSAHAVSIGGYALYQALRAPVRSDLAVNRKVGPYGASTATIVLVPMPITPRRLRERGFNQCDLLVDEIERLDTGDRFTVEKNLLVRVHHDSRQTLKGREDRLESAKGIFGVNEEVLKKYKSHDSQLTDDSSPPYKGGARRRFSRVATELVSLDSGDLRFIIIDDVITTGSTMKEAMETLKKAGMENVSGLALAH